MKDWDSCEVVCALRKGGTSIRRLSIEAGLHPDTLKAATNRKYRRGERIIADALGLKIARAATPGTHPLFVAMIRELIQERLDPSRPKRAMGTRGPNHDVCPPDCCPAPVRLGRP